VLVVVHAPVDLKEWGLCSDCSPFRFPLCDDCVYLPWAAAPPAGGGDPSSAIQFLVMSGAMEDAFQLAQKHSQMGVYASVIGSKGSIAQFRSIAAGFFMLRHIRSFIRQ